MFLDERISLGTSSLLERIGTIISRLEREKKEFAIFQDLFQQLRQLLGSFANMMLLSDGRCLDDVLLEYQFQHVKRHSWRWNNVLNVLFKLRSLALMAEDNVAKVYTEIALYQQERKQEAAARRSVVLRLSFSKGKYRRSLLQLHSELKNTVSLLQELRSSRALEICSSFIEYLGSSWRCDRAGSPPCARGMDSDLDEEILASESSSGELITLMNPIKVPIVATAEAWPRDEDLKAIVMRLLSALDEDHTKDDKVPVVLPIVGVPGVGKTTLAWFLHRNDQVSTHFRRSLWLDVSNGFNLGLIAKVIEAIAIGLRWMPDQQEIEKETTTVTGNDDGQHTFMKISGRYRNVHQHRYLIIVDGLKYEDQHKWLAFRESLKGTRSHVIITTRHRAAVSEDSAMAYVLQGLPELCSWQFLLANKLHGQNNSLSKPQPRFIARAVHCSAGVPLALDILRHHMDTDPRYLNCKEVNILRSSCSLADDMLRDFVLNLPDHSRNCFAYCSLFPPGYEMDKSTLIQLWMAQGFIPTQSDRDAEELGSECFRDLLDRSLLSETYTDEFGNIKSCKMHKLMHDLSLLIASHIINKDWLPLQSSYSDISKFLHVSHGNPHFWFENEKSVLQNLRTLLHLDQEEFEDSSFSHPSLEEIIEQRISKSKELRVLDLHKENIKRMPTSINEMKLLRYLDLSGNHHIIMLPDSITRLIHLETLKLSHCKKLKELPNDIARLEKLRHLEIVGCLGLTHMPRGIGQLTALRTLSMFVVGDESGTSLGVGELSELKALNHLRGNLELRHLEKARSLSLASLALEKKENLESVALVWETTDAEDADGSAGDDERTLEGLQRHQKLKGFSIYGYGGVNFPEWLSSLFNLVKITVKDCHSCQSLPPLHQLPLLKYLILESMDSLEYIISDISATAPEGLHENSTVEGSSNDAKSFPSLIHLCLKELPSLKGWLKVNDTTSNTDQILAHPFPAVEDLHICMLSKKQLEKLLLQFPLSSLIFLCISYVKDLDYLPETLSLYLGSIQKLELQYCPNLSCLPTFLVTLKLLSVVGCNGLTSLPQGIRCLQALETLKLKYCFELDLQKLHNHVVPHSDIDLKWWPQFDLARSDHGGYLRVQEVEDSSYFAGLESLSYLEIKQLPELVSLPDGICELPSLQQLCLSGCARLKYLPEGIQRMRNLYKIKINGCPLLQERCRDKTSGEWEKICHIWDRDLDWDEDEDQVSIEKNKNPEDEDEISRELDENPYSALFLGD